MERELERMQGTKNYSRRTFVTRTDVHYGTALSRTIYGIEWYFGTHLIARLFEIRRSHDLGIVTQVIRRGHDVVIGSVRLPVVLHFLVRFLRAFANNGSMYVCCLLCHGRCRESVIP